MSGIFLEDSQGALCPSVFVLSFFRMLAMQLWRPELQLQLGDLEKGPGLTEPSGGSLGIWGSRAARQPQPARLWSLIWERLTLLPCVFSLPVTHSQMDSQLIQGVDEDRNCYGLNCVSPLKFMCWSLSAQYLRMGLREVRMKSREYALIQMTGVLRTRRDKDTTTSRGWSCGLTVRRWPSTGQEERPKEKTTLPTCQSWTPTHTSRPQPPPVCSGALGSGLNTSYPWLTAATILSWAEFGACLGWLGQSWGTGPPLGLHALEGRVPSDWRLEWAAGSSCLPTAPGGDSHLAGLLGVGWGRRC